jgi:hypothetical protein
VRRGRRASLEPAGVDRRVNFVAMGAALPARSRPTRDSFAPIQVQLNGMPEDKQLKLGFRNIR